MNIIVRKTIFIIISLIVGLLTGCGLPSSSDSDDFAASKKLGPTIGSLAKISVQEEIPVSGFGLVGGLHGTGSSECPPQIKTYLTQHYLRQLSTDSTLEVEKFIESMDTAVVLVEGVIPRMASKGQVFDLRVTALPGTQTTSLKDGRLFVTELKLPGTFGRTTKVLALAEGPIYVDGVDSKQMNENAGFVLAGGATLDEYKVILELPSPDYTITSDIRNFLNGRFGDQTAKAVIPGRIELSIPQKYRDRKDRFIDIIRATYIGWTPAITELRIQTFIDRLTSSPDKYASEVALEAIGRECLSGLKNLLDSSNEEIRLRAARCMVHIGSDEGLKTLKQIALDPGSSYRIEAINAIASAHGRKDASLILRELLEDGSFDIRFVAYEQLLKLNHSSVVREPIAKDFYLDSVSQAELKTIYVSRSGRPRVVLFGAPIYCGSNIFIQSAGGDVTINSTTGQEYVTIIRKHPKRPNVTAQLRCSFDLRDIIRTLCEEPLREDGQDVGLGVSYSDMVALLKLMCDKGAIDAEFKAGPLPKIG